MAKKDSVPVHGLLNIDKPSGMTSRDVVNHVQKRLPRKTRIGHTGTLDPLADGVLVLCIGSATRLAEYVQRMEKEYVTDIVLGASSETDDADGEIIPWENPHIPDRDQMNQTLKQFVGEISQIPPQFSAAKIGGKRSYNLARKGTTVSLQARPVVVKEIVVESYQYPHLRLRIRCGKGTYIRSIARDLGDSLKCGGYVGTLCRTRVGPFFKEDGLSLEDLNREPLQCQPVEKALAELPTTTLSEEEVNRFVQGQFLPLTATHNDSSKPKVQELAVFGPNGRLLGVGMKDEEEGLFKPVKVLQRAP